MPKLFQANRTKPVTPVFNVANLGGGEAEITLYGEVMEESPKDYWSGESLDGVYISVQEFNEKLDEIKDASHITVHLNSCGGDLFAGLAIHNVLKALPASITVKVEGIAASAASVIACAGDEVVVMPGSIFMVHSAAAFLFGYYNSADLTTMCGQIDACNKSIVNVYAAKTGRDIAELAELVEAETWLIGDEIVDAGFADTLDESSTSTTEVDEDGEGIVTNGLHHDVSAFKNMPVSRIAAAMDATKGKQPTTKQVTTETGVNPATDAHISAAPPQAAEKEGEDMDYESLTLDNLRAERPDLIREVENAAATAERERIAAIDGIAASVPADMVEDAKYANPMDAAQLALAAMQRDAQARAAYVADAKEDEDDSGAEDVPAAPEPSEEEDEKAEAQASVDEAIAYVKKIGA